MAEKWHILGAGALGSLFASHLAKARLPVQLLHRDQAGAAPPPRPLELIEPERRLVLDIERGQVCDSGTIGQLLVCTKANQVQTALSAVLPRLAPQAPVILLHNGMGTLESALELLPAGRLFCGVTTEGAYLDGPNRLVYAGRGGTELGQQGRADPPPWFADLQRALPRLDWEANIERSLWRKLLINCAINPLTALYKCRNGELPAARGAQLEELCQELGTLAVALGQEEAARDLQATVVQVCQATAENRSSMLSDIEAGRTSEIEYITGFLCRQAQAAGLPHPLNARLLQQVRDMQTGRE